MRAIHEQSELARAIAAHTGLSEREAERAAAAVVEALAHTVPPRAAHHLGDLLLGVKPREQPPIETLAELVTDVAFTLGAPPGEALEIVDSACAAIAGGFSDDDRRVVVGALPPELGALFDPDRAATTLDDNALAAATAEMHHAPGAPAHRERHTLSSGDPGGAHPIASSPPDDGAHTLATGRAKVP